MFVQTLHATTINFGTGALKAVDKGGTTHVSKGEPSKFDCTPAERTKVQELIDAYTKATPNATAACDHFKSLNCKF